MGGLAYLIPLKDHNAPKNGKICTLGVNVRNVKMDLTLVAMNTNDESL